MGAWDAYKSRIQINGKTSREESLLYEKWYLTDRSKDGLFYHTVKINGETVNLNIINSDNLNEKMIYSMPDETFPCGGYMEWANNMWLITEKDANDEVYTRGKVLQCNHLLKWIDPESREIHEQWCVVEDGTKLKRVSGTHAIVWHMGNCMQERFLELLETPESLTSYNVMLKYISVNARKL